MCTDNKNSLGTPTLISSLSALKFTNSVYQSSEALQLACAAYKLCVTTGHVSSLTASVDSTITLLSKPCMKRKCLYAGIQV